VTREQLVEEVWGTERQPNTRTIDNLIMQLRQRIEGDPSQPRWIRTVHGAGYRLVDATDESGSQTHEGDGS
jgi:DNA-binding response OmpR family regulator